MRGDVELSTLNARYECHRQRDDVREARLLASISERGIEEPLEGVDTVGGRFLLNGFKRYRCAWKLTIACVPYVSLGNEEATGIVATAKTTNSQFVRSFGINCRTPERFSCPREVRLLLAFSCYSHAVRHLAAERCANGYAGRTSRPANCWSK